MAFVRVKAVELDAEGNWVRDCLPGERGVLLTTSPTVTPGYLSAALNDTYFPKGVPDGDSSGAGWGNTGDLGSVDEDGYVWIFGRAKDLIIRGGHNIDPKEIEDALSSHPAVHLAAAVGRPDRTKGEMPIAYVELVEGAAASAEDLMAHCRQRVQERAAAPVEIIVVPRIPLTPVGKVAKPVLRADALEREIRSAVGQLVDEFDVELDSSGPRMQVLVHVAEDDGVVERIEKELLGYEFNASVRALPPGLSADLGSPRRGRGIDVSEV